MLKTNLETKYLKMNNIRIKVMPPVNSTGVYRKQKEYSVSLNAANSVSFKNKQDAENYAALVSKNINEFLRIANKSYLDLFTIYRNIWPMIDERNNKVLVEFCDRLNSDFTAVFKRESSSAFSTCYSIFKTLKEFLSSMEDLLQKRKMYLHLYQCTAVGAVLNSNSFSIQIIKSQLKE